VESSCRVNHRGFAGHAAGNLKKNGETEYKEQEDGRQTERLPGLVFFHFFQEKWKNH